MKTCDYTKIFKALSHDIRLQIACGLIHKGSCNVNTISERLGVSQSLVSQHLSILKNAGIIKGYREKNMVWYRIENELAKKLLENIEINICEEQ
jgi:ArsR family transcriptional regulator